MGRLMKAFGKGTYAACVEDCDDSDGDPFVPNDFAEDDPFQASEKCKRSSDFPVENTFTRYSGKLLSTIIGGLSPSQVSVLQSYRADCLLKFVRTEVPLRFVKWLASKFDEVYPISKYYVIHDILDLPVDGEPIVSDADAGREFILSHFNETSIPPVSFFCNKLKYEELPDEDIFICFMCIALSTFLCPNSSLSPSPIYLHCM
ncbi:hypothetical protein VPH35_070137 [Triticum aestivum]